MVKYEIVLLFILGTRFECQTDNKGNKNRIYSSWLYCITDMDLRLARRKAVASYVYRYITYVYTYINRI